MCGRSTSTAASAGYRKIRPGFDTREGSVMRTVVAIAINLGFALMLFIGTAIAQERGGAMLLRRMPMMGWPGDVVLWVFWILLLILMVLAILWLIKQLRRGMRPIVRRRSESRP